MIKEIFLEEEAKRICTMVISPLGQKDRVVWAGTKKGNFSVRSAYHMAKEISLAEVGECSNEGEKEKMWQTL